MTIFESPDGEVDVPECSITEMVMAGLEGRSGEPAVIDGPTGRIVTRGEMQAGIKALAGGLTAAGLAPGKTIALMAPNMPEFVIAFHGAAWAGDTITTINPTYTAEEVHGQLVNSGAILLVTVPPFKALAEEAMKGTGVGRLAVIGEESFAALMGAPLATQAPIDPETHVVALPYSSGTTGMPKGVMLTHRNLVANVVQISVNCGIEPGEATPAFLPFFHIYGLEVLVNLYLQQGACLVTLPRFDLELFLRIIQEHRARKLWIVPPVGIALAKHPMIDQFDLSSVTQILSGAAPMGSELTGQIHDRLGCLMFQGYGMTEMSPVSHFSDPKHYRTGACGRMVPGTRCRIRDPETGKDLGPGHEGELVVQGPQVMKGYLNNPEATAAVLDAEGWLRTGDIALVDEDGYLFIRDRLKELIKVSGFQVAPAEVEAALLSHPQIRDAAVIGEPDPEAGEIPMAFIVPAEGVTLTLEDIRNHLAPHLASYKLPRDMELVDSIPKSASGKILRRLLKNRVA